MTVSNGTGGQRGNSDWASHFDGDTSGVKSLRGTLADLLFVERSEEHVSNFLVVEVDVIDEVVYGVPEHIGITIGFVAG